MQALLEFIKGEINEEAGQDPQMFKTLERSPDKKGVFWAYSESEKDSHEEAPENQPPKILVRCLNEFSDYDE
jgi:hypothetical protein